MGVGLEYIKQHGDVNRRYYYLRAIRDAADALLSSEETAKKRKAELSYWEFQKARQGSLDSNHFEYFYTEKFDLAREYYTNKHVLDIGCGPRGSLNWATMATDCVGLDPLVDAYKARGLTEHSKMRYVDGRAENIPFANNHFDIVTSFNSLDHVDDLDASLAEIKRVLKPTGLFLLITDVNHEPTVTEPVSFDWDLVTEFRPELQLVEQDCREKTEDGIYASAVYSPPYDFTDDSQRYGVLSAKFRKLP